jgi:uncharacterized protein YpiB (UPF0302 family)
MTPDTLLWQGAHMSLETPDLLRFMQQVITAILLPLAGWVAHSLQAHTKTLETFRVVLTGVGGNNGLMSRVHTVETNMQMWAVTQQHVTNIQRELQDLRARMDNEDRLLREIQLHLTELTSKLDERDVQEARHFQERQEAEFRGRRKEQE